MMAMEGNLLFLLFGLVSLGFGAVGLGRELRSFRRQRSSRSWPTVDGVLKHAGLLPSEAAWDTEEAWQGSRRRTHPRAKTGYQVYVEYDYRYAGEDYASYRYAFQPKHRGFKEREEAEAVIDQLTSVSWIPVRVDPTRPSRAVLDSDQSPWRGVQLPAVFISAFFGAIGLVAIVLIAPVLLASV